MNREIFEDVLLRLEEEEKISLAEKLAILESLDINFTNDEQLKELKENEEEEMPVTFTVLLEMIGMGEEDEETGKWIPSSNKVYAFDSEVSDVDNMYTHFIEGVLAISNQEFGITEIEEVIEEDERHYIKFQYNDHSYEFVGETEGDWMDCRIIDFMNQVFVKENNSKFLLCMPNESQGFNILYNTQEWAMTFAEKTFNVLSISYALGGDILPEV